MNSTEGGWNLQYTGAIHRKQSAEDKENQEENHQNASNRKTRSAGWNAYLSRLPLIVVKIGTEILGNRTPGQVQF